MRDRVSSFLLLCLIVALPFEPTRHFLGLGLLQWLFLALVVASLPQLAGRLRALRRDRVFVAGAVFLTVCFVSALSSDDPANALKATLRVSAGLSLFALAGLSGNRTLVVRVWAVTAIAAAGYGLLDYFGLGYSQLFRDQNYFVGTVPRLSGSFEYPTTAAAYFAMSIPVAWSATNRAMVKYAAVSALWLVLTLTLSRGAAVAAAGGLILGGLIVWGKGFRRNDTLWQRIRAGLIVAGIGVAVYSIVGAVEPLSWRRMLPGGAAEAVAVEYHPGFNQLVLPAGGVYELEVHVINQGQGTWRSSGERRISLSSYWYDVDAERILPLETRDVPLPVDVPPGAGVDLVVRVDPPPSAGRYLLDLDMRQAGYGLFSNAGEYPGVVEVQVATAGEAVFQAGDVDRWYRRGPGYVPRLDATVGRLDLWRAAAGMIRSHPVFGVGPDNYRLLYGTSLGYSVWDQKIRSNNLYLELASTTGLAGLAAFLVMLAAGRYAWWPGAASIAVFLVHGTVDVFLMTTPIYFSFWLMLAFAHEDRF